MLFLKAHAAETEKAAKDEVRETIFWVVDQTLELYARLGASTPEYAYLSRLTELEDRKRDLDHLVERAPYFSVGTPAFLVEQCRRLEAMGVDEVLLDIDGVDHERHMQAIRLIGEQVIPEFSQ